jgi:hypothetical protein
MVALFSGGINTLYYYSSIVNDSTLNKAWEYVLSAKEAIGYDTTFESTLP